MSNLKLEIEYDGTDYCGWQAQRSVRFKSIQEVIEKALQKILREKVKLIASGRTDAGVHALGQVANFKTSARIKPDKLMRGLNALLPDDIRVCRVQEVGPDFHSRFQARSKVYRYTILNRKAPSAFSRNTVYFYPYPLDIKLMQKEARALVGRHNFKSFQTSGSKERASVRTIKRLKISKEGERIIFEIEADGFLYNMVRNIVGTLIETGRGRLSKGSLKKILSALDRRLAGPTAAAKGLCLLKVKY
ncbi:MAG TPA: tRNA pseudouridine(38-40) synthase TruA [Candidatus Margulisiibacteriota bacterium]|nr:tRNA pseudouridine(38-40) synthase TruA [Candidatus Margulisiibacteriota bacterium]